MKFPSLFSMAYLLSLLVASRSDGLCASGDQFRENENFYDFVSETKLARRSWSTIAFPLSSSPHPRGNAKKKDMPQILGPMGPPCKPEYSLVLGGKQLQNRYVCCGVRSVGIHL